MAKGEKTRQAILDSAAQVFSVRGYAGTSMDDLTRAAHLTKGGIYNHFASKDELALQAFDYAIERIRERFKVMIDGKRSTRSRLLAQIALLRSLVDDPLLRGGCPVLNTATEADDTHPALAARAQTAAGEWRSFIQRNIAHGIDSGEVRADVDAEEVWTVIVGMMQGAIVLSKLYGELRHMDYAVTHLTGYVDSLMNNETVS